ncbi:MAG: RluA family pseudouridine synthase [Clostridia bacterium]|nr:RluA family pseudouridine synthase [Oscillospiraceae bacterium]MBR4892568.1 RluA family pseudouridine synthase [Clostridia bacterium]
MEEIKITVTKNDNIRIDKYLCEKLETFTRNNIANLIDKEMVSVNGKKVKSNYKPKLNDEITLTVPDPVMLDVKAEEIPLEIVYEDDDILVINKPKGMVVHPAAGNYEGTLVNALLGYCKDSLSEINGVIRPGIVHRIDKDTSGLLLVAKTNRAHLSLAEQIKQHSAKREYLALVIGEVKEDGTVNAPIGRSEKDRKKMAVTYKNSKEAITHYTVKERYNGYTLLHCRLETGRTHQIRVHMSYIGKPILGDMVYGPKKQKFNLDGQMLHAFKIGFTHPVTKEPMTFETELPEYFLEILDKLSKKV